MDIRRDHRRYSLELLVTSLDGNLIKIEQMVWSAGARLASSAGTGCGSIQTDARPALGSGKRILRRVSGAGTMIHVMHYLLAEQIVRDYICSNCWGHLVEFIEPGQMSRVECANCGADTRLCNQDLCQAAPGK